MDAAALIAAVESAGFTFAVTDAGPSLTPPHKGAALDPALLAELKARRAEVLEVLCACPVCGRCVPPEDRGRMRDPAHCDRGGSAPVRNRQGQVVLAATPRCPFKQPS